ncbi:hypothetical protein D3C78_790470 [compost metagenome]
MGLEEAVGEGVRLGVEHQVDVALAQQADVLRAVATGLDEAQAGQPLAELGAVRLVDGEFEELDAVVAAGRRRREQHAGLHRLLLFFE